MSNANLTLDGSTSAASQDEALASSAGTTGSGLDGRSNDPFEFEEITHRRWRCANPVRVARAY